MTLPKGIKMVAWARAVRWTGWGFGEALIPVFIFSFAGSFAEAGLIRSVYEMVMLLSLPLVGAWADRASAKRIMVVALFLYPIVGISYLLAGVYGAAIFVVLARILNGFLWSADSIGASTYYRRISQFGSLGRAFGYLESWSMLGWICAAIISSVVLFFVEVPIHWLIFLNAPFAVLAFLIIKRIPSDVVGAEHPEHKKTMSRSYLEEFAEWRSWNLHLWLLSALQLFAGFIQAMIWFFIPIDAYVEGASLPLVILLSIAASIPVLCGYWLGKVVDKIREYKLIVYGLIVIATLTCSIAIFPEYAFKLTACFLLGIVLELFTIVQEKLLTKLGPAERYGMRGSAYESIATIGDLSAPLALGIAFDVIGFQSVALYMAMVSMVFALVYAFVSKTRTQHL